MDPQSLILLLQGTAFGWLIPYIAIGVVVASILDAILPQPGPASPWLPLRKLITLTAVNIGHARNVGQPTLAEWASLMRGKANAPQPPTGPKPGGGSGIIAALLLIVLLASTLTACANTANAPLPVQVYAAEVRLDAALAAADAYVHSPGANPGAVKAIKALNEAAHVAVLSADAALAQPDPQAAALAASLAALDGIAAQIIAATPAQQKDARQ